MSASTNDLFKKTGAGTVTTLAAPGKAMGATSINVGSTANMPTTTGIIIAMRTVDTSGNLVAGTYTEWSATVASATSLSIVGTPVYGNDQVYTAGSTTQVFIPASSYGYNTLIDGILVSHDQDGTLKDGVATPTGVVNPYAGSSAPTGWLLCDGSAVSRTNYAALFAVISTTYGVGDNSTTFNLPNLKGKVAVGFDATQTEFDTLGETGGEKTHTLITAELASHSHVFKQGSGTAGSTDDAYKNLWLAGGGDGGGGSSSATLYNDTSQGVQSAGSGTAHNNLQPYIALNYIIKY